MGTVDARVGGVKMFNESIFTYLSGYAEAWDIYNDESPYKLGKEELLGVVIRYLREGNLPSLTGQPFNEVYYTIEDNINLLLESRG